MFAMVAFTLPNRCAMLRLHTLFNSRTHAASDVGKGQSSTGCALKIFNNHALPESRRRQTLPC
jgi:hypothetical protein